MATINERLILTDGFSASFRSFIQMGAQASRSADSLRKATEAYGASTVSSAQQLNAMKNILLSQRQLYTSQTQHLRVQSARVDELTQKYNRLVTEKGKEATETLRVAAALARAQTAEARLGLQANNTLAAITRQKSAISELVEKIQETPQASEDAVNAQNEHTDAVNETANSATRLLGILRNIVTVMAIAGIIKQATEFSDTVTQIKAKLDLINDGAQSQEELQRMIYNAAQRSRSSYEGMANMVVRLGQNAKEAFNSNAEMVQFAENLNKQFAIAGASQEEIASATLQLTQALSSGVLRGEELNAVFESAPNVIRNIAEYLGEDIGKIRELASEGKLSATVVKNALLQATEDIDKTFKSIPMTFGGAMNMIRNYAMMAFQNVGVKLNNLLNSDTGQVAIMGIIGALHVFASVASGAIDLLASGAEAVQNNWDYIAPILAGIAMMFVALGAVAVASAIKAGVAWAIANWPIILIGAAAVMLIFTLRQMGVTWAQMGEVAGAVLGFLYTYVYTVVAYWWNIFASFAEFFANVFNDPVTAIANLFADLLDNILSVVETAAQAIDALLGSDLAGAVSGFRDDISNFVKDKIGENEIQIRRMETADLSENMKAGAEIGKNLGAKLDNMSFSFDDFSKGFNTGAMDFSDLANSDVENVGSVGSVKNIEGDVNLSDEDIKMYRDLAERRYMNNVELQTVAPQISISIDGSEAKNLTAQDIADKLKVMLIQQQAAHTATAHG